VLSVLKGADSAKRPGMDSVGFVPLETEKIPTKAAVVGIVGTLLRDLSVIPSSRDTHHLSATEDRKHVILYLHNHTRRRMHLTARAPKKKSIIQEGSCAK